MPNYDILIQQETKRKKAVLMAQLAINARKAKEH